MSIRVRALKAGIFAILLAAMPLAAAPLGSTAHCGDVVPALAHHGHDTSPPLDDREQCPHCPPADCQAQPQCASTLDGVMVASSALPQSSRLAGAEVAAQSRWRSFESPPRTPPPQVWS